MQVLRKNLLILLRSLKAYKSSMKTPMPLKLLMKLPSARIVLDLKKDGTPEGISKIENIEELLNGIKDFTEGQQNWQMPRVL